MHEYDEKIGKVKNILNERKCARLESEAKDNLSLSVHYINKLKKYVEGEVEVNANDMQQVIDHLIGCNTLTFDSILPCEIKIKRGQAINAESVNSVQRLSYNMNKEKIRQGRFNTQMHSFFYGVIHFRPDFGNNVIFSELGVEKGQHVCILNSKTNKKLSFRLLGIFERVRKNDKPAYIDKNTWNYYKTIHDLYQRLSYEQDFDAFLLTENFLYDLISKEKSQLQKVYDVTNAIGDIFLDSRNIDGLVYGSIFDRETPNIMLKASAVDDSLSFLDVEEFLINKKYPHNVYDAALIRKGKILSSLDVDWVPGCQ